MYQLFSLARIQNTFNFSEADKKVKEIAKQNEWHDGGENKNEINFILLFYFASECKKFAKFPLFNREKTNLTKPNEDVHQRKKGKRARASQPICQSRRRLLQLSAYAGQRGSENVEF